MDSIELNNLIEKGFSIQCIDVRRDFEDVEMLFKLSHDDYDSIYFKQWFGDKGYRMAESMNSILNGIMLIRLNDEIYVELKDFGFFEIYDVLFEDEEFEQMKKSNQMAITILKSVFE